MKGNGTCTVCKAEATGNYCSNCGQKISKDATTVWSMITDVASNVFSLEKSVFASLLKLIVNPRQLIDNYWQGYRSYYPSPGKVFFYALAFAALHISYVDENILGMSIAVDNMQAQTLFWIIFFPILTLTSYLTFIRSRHGITKHIISILYLASGFFIIIIVLNSAIIWLFDDILTGGAFILFALCVFIWNAIVFSPKRSYLRIFLNVVLELFIFLSIITAIVGLLYLANPEVIQI